MNLNDYLFEISFEVCNKVGGIHTVISSKASEIMKHVSNYFVLGPAYLQNNSEFCNEECPKQLEKVSESLAEIGIKIYFGKWNIKGSPNTILVDYIGYSKNINNIKTYLWEKHKIDSINSDWYDFDEVLLWSWCCGIVIDKITENVPENQTIHVHAHEWISGGSIFYLKSLDYYKKFKTVFTTHATMLGRSLSGSGQNVYELENKIDAMQKAYEMGVGTKHQTEKTLAFISDVFSTVSSITAKESIAFYGKNPDILLYNGFDNLQRNFQDNINENFYGARTKLNNFLKKYFSDFYEIDLDSTYLFYTSGRNEFRSKGWDLYIKSLSKLNEKLRLDKNPKSVISLFLIPIGNFEKDPRFEGKGESFFKQSLGLTLAPLASHHVPINNQIISEFIKNGLLNKKEDNVKVILIPVYISEKDNIFNRGYYEVIEGCDMGIFTSYYEPWGYTPLESIAYGVPSVTTDLAGFGQTVLNEFGGSKIGVEVLRRLGVEFDLVVDNLKDSMYDFIQKEQKDLLLEKRGSYIFSKNFSWHVFIKNYLKAYDMAKNKE